MLAALREKHPEARKGAITPAQRELLQAAAHPEEISVKELITCLRKFPPGSSPGPSGISPSVLLSLITLPGSAVGPVVAPVVHAIISGGVPKAYRAIIFGARLVPLVKKDKAIRPIAAGEAIRRVGAKIMAKRLAEKFRKVLILVGQIGVAVGSGLEALASWARQAARIIRRGESIAKVDFKNAFNAFYRCAMTDAVLKHMPELALYVDAAYSEPSLLFVGTHTISSESGVQQGDPLGPVLFSLAALHCIELPEEIRSHLRGSGWYLDDGLFVGPSAYVHAALSHVKNKAAEIGLEMNVSKTEILSASRDTWEPFLNDFPCWRSLDEFELLGLPCSPSDAGVEAFTQRFLERIESRTAAINAVSKVDAHVGYLLLRMCTGFAACVHLACVQTKVRHQQKHTLTSYTGYTVDTEALKAPIL